MTVVSIKINGLDELRRALKQEPQIAKKHIKKAVNVSALKVVSDLKTGGYVPYQTGNLKRKIRVQFGDSKATIIPYARYAGYVHDGTRPHIITVRFKRVLANKKEGKIFGKRVRHPGTKAQPFLEEAAQRNSNEVDREFQSALDNIAQEIANKAR